MVKDTVNVERKVVLGFLRKNGDIFVKVRTLGEYFFYYVALVYSFMGRGFWFLEIGVVWRSFFFVFYRFVTR